MKLGALRAIAGKDLRESASNNQVLAPILILPLVFVVLYPVGLLIALRYLDPKSLQQNLGNLPMGMFPGASGLTAAGQVAYVATVYLFAPFFLIIPTMVATILSANSFAGEKERHTLEGVLYTPVTDSELVLGKIAGSVLPAVAFSWVCFVLYAVLVTVFGEPLVGRVFFPTLNWLVLMLLLVPAVAVFITSCVVWVSARVTSYQAANSIGGFAVLPLVVLVIGQVTGVMVASTVLFAVIGVVLAAADIVLVWAIVATFDRERVVSSFV